MTKVAYYYIRSILHNVNIVAILLAKKVWVLEKKRPKVWDKVWGGRTTDSGDTIDNRLY